MTRRHQLLKNSRVIGKVCDYCVTPFGGEKDLFKKKELPLIDEYTGHSSITRLNVDCYQTINL